MAIQIIPASEPIRVDQINLVVYAPPGIGKTTLACSSNSPLLLDFDQGAARAPNRGDTVRITKWQDIERIEASDLQQYETIILDTAGRALDMLTLDIIAKNPKHGYNGNLNQQGWGQLKNRFTTFLKKLNSFGKDIVLIAHMTEIGAGDEVNERLDMQGASKNEVYKTADAIGRIKIRDKIRYLMFSPDETAYGKNPAGFEPIAIPHVTDPHFSAFLARIISDTKTRLNAHTEDQARLLEEQKWFSEKLPKTNTADGLSELISRANEGGEVFKRQLWQHAKVLGFSYNKTTECFQDPSSTPMDECA